MLINNVLNNVFSAKSNIMILRAMQNYNVGITGREVSRISGLSPRACFVTLTSLENIGIIKRLRGGRDHLFVINRENYLVSEAIIPLLNAESSFFESIKNDLKLKLRNKCNSVYIFGSVARRDESNDSDFDICLVMNGNDERNLMEEILADLISDTFRKYGITLSPFYITLNEFEKRLKSNKAPVPDIVKEGIVVYGKRINSKW